MRKLCIFLALAAMTMGMEAKTMVVYFSATGTTKAAAQQIAKAQKATLWEIQPAEPYTAADLDWRNKQSRSSLEMNDPEARPAIKQCTNIMPYDTIYVGYPIWWGICPPTHGWTTTCRSWRARRLSPSPPPAVPASSSPWNICARPTPL